MISESSELLGLEMLEWCTLLAITELCILCKGQLLGRARSYTASIYRAAPLMSVTE